MITVEHKGTTYPLSWIMKMMDDAKIILVEDENPSEPLSHQEFLDSYIEKFGDEFLK